MDFTLSKQQQMVQKMYREFAENEVKPLAKKVDAEEYFPKETVEKMGKLGMMGIYFPTSVGGAGGDVLSYVMAVEELSKVCGTTGVIVSAHTSLCAAPIYENGTPEQKAKYLPKLCSGEWLGAFGLTEPGAGTDAQGQQTIAKEDGDYWVLNGSKIFITNAGLLMSSSSSLSPTSCPTRRAVPPSCAPPSSWSAPTRASPSARLRTRWASVVLPPAS